MSLWARIETCVLTQRGSLMPWSPVLLAAGIGCYFLLRFEPSLLVLVLFGVASLTLFVCARYGGPVTGAMLIALALISGGFSLAGTRAHLVAGPVLEFRYYGAVEGRVVGIDRSASGAIRLTLDQVRLHRVVAVPKRVRISLHGAEKAEPLPGSRVMTTALLGPPRGPVEPGGFDFRRHAWFLGLGAVGYTRVPLLISEPSAGTQKLLSLRMKLSRFVQTALPGEVGAFGAAITTGDRSGMSEQTRETLRRTNLSHLLAISGLHMGLLAGFVFGIVRLGLALVPYTALFWPIRKIAALAGLIASAMYLMLSGGNVATERAFVMVAVALVAILFDRRAISLRAVALAALIVLVLRPEALLGPGFQMSFAATTALVAVFAMLRDDRVPEVPRWLRPVLMVALSSAVAGLATAPVAAAHFNRISQFGLLANLLSVPLMGMLVVPAAVLAACLAPFGLEDIALWAMGQGLRWVLAVAAEIASWQGVVRAVISPMPWVLPLMAFGGLILALWRGRGAILGFVPMAISLVFWALSERPAILIADDGGLVGVQTSQGRALSRARGNGFVAEVWLENDGDLAVQQHASERWKGLQRFVAQGNLPTGGTIWHIRGKRAARSFEGCDAGDIAVFDREAPANLACTVYDPDVLRQSGAIAIVTSGKITAAAALNGTRLWSGATRPPNRKLARARQ